MKKIYKYSFSRHTLSLTTIYLTIFLALGIGLYFLYEGGYLSAWFFSFIVALVALMSLSIPRRILVDDEGLHILCLLDITELHPEEIASVRQVEKQELRGYVPYFGGYGFFGFYGHYFDLKNLERVKIYASEWRNFSISVTLRAKSIARPISSLGIPIFSGPNATSSSTIEAIC